MLQLSLRYKEDGQFWFSFFYEASHILLHGKKDIFIEDKSAADPEHSEQKEQEANQFAADQQIAPGIIVGRLQHDKVLPFSHCNDLKVKFVWARR